ncbi:MAG: ankyrin repeat domain-containing protein, partial [Succinivibrionaceae bacterium]|nr:ankyrin repeat domain-containing protein [Succinivibrionaceae bacterium]
KVLAKGTISVQDGEIQAILGRLGLLPAGTAPSTPATASATSTGSAPASAASTGSTPASTAPTGSTPASAASAGPASAGPAPASAAPAGSAPASRPSLAPADPSAYLRQKGTFEEKLEELKSDLRNGLDPNGNIYARGHEQPLVIFALRENNEELLSLLVEKGADLNRPYREYDYPPVSPLYHYLERFGGEKLKEGIIRTLIKGGADLNWSSGKQSVLKAMLGAPLPLLGLYLDHKPSLKGFPSVALDFLKSGGKNRGPQHAALFRKLLELGADPNPQGLREPLIMAAWEYGPEYAEALADFGAAKGTDQHGDPLIFGAIGDGNPGLLGLLLGHGADPNAQNHSGHTALEEAIDESGPDPALARILLGHGADPNLKGSKSQELPIFAALEADHPLPLVKEMLEHGADPSLTNEDGENALQAALGNDECPADLLRLLIERCAGQGQVNGLLHLALVNSGCPPEIVSLLLGRGADANSTAGDGTPALMLAFDRDEVDPALISMLLGRGARADAADSDGKTALMAAAGNPGCKGEVFRLLLSNGAKAGALTSDGKDALLYAFRAENPDAVAALLGAGASPQAALSGTTTVRHGKGKEATKETLTWREYFSRAGDQDPPARRQIRDLLKDAH